MRSPLAPVLVGALVAFLVVWGVALRLADPLSTRAIGAEDPYTHIVFMKEWLAQGFFADSFHLGTPMYPPGMHAFVGVFASVAGLSLYDFARLAPALVGGVAILGMYALGARLANPAAGLGAAFLATIMPEHIFRTELLFPTAFDLALLPLWIIAFDMMLTPRVAEGRAKGRASLVAGALLFVGASVPLAIMHPWAVPLFGAPLGAYAAFRVLRGKVSAEALVGAYAALSVAIGFAVAFRWKESGTGFSDFLAQIPGFEFVQHVDQPFWVIFLGVVPVLLAGSALVGGAVWLLSRVPVPRAARIAIGLSIGAACLAVLPIVTRAPPHEVSYRDMFGPIVIVAGVAGFALAWARPTALGDLGVGLVFALLPLTAIDLFHSEFWPQRSAVYLGVAIALCGAGLAGALWDAAPRILRSPRATRAAAPIAVVAVALVAAGAATAYPVDTYEWYRLYDEDSFAAYERLADVLDKEPAARVFVAGWQPALMVKTLTDPSHVWYSPKFFKDPDVRATNVEKVAAPAYVITDRFNKGELGFLDDDPFHLVFEQGSVRFYEVRT